ncbi:MAG: TolC family protein [Bacteroidaceae bacterium]|nr:TolC family protein [Bacteroidaceae bacterium]
MKTTITAFALLIFSSLAATAQTYTLEQLRDSALRNNMAIRSARYRIEAARQQRKEAFTKYFPNVSGMGLWFNANRGMAKTVIDPSEVMSPELGASLAQTLPPEALVSLSTPMSMSMMKNGTMGSLVAMQPVFAGGQIANGNRLAKVGEEVSLLQMQLSENEVEQKVEEYYWQLVSLTEKMRTIEAVDTMLGSVERDVKVAVEAGVTMRNDLLQVQLRRNDIVGQRLKVSNGIFIVKQLLGQYAGLAQPASDEKYAFDIVQPDISRDEQPLSLPLEAGADVGTTPEYQLLGKQVEAADLQKQLAVGKQMPSVAVGAGYTYHNFLENDRTFGMVFATVSLPISDWWGGSHAIRRRKIELRQAEEEQRDNAELLRIRMLNAWNAVEEARQQLTLSREGVAQAEENLRLYRDYYRAGTARIAELLEAQLLYQQTLDRHTDAFAAYQLRLLEYRHAGGNVVSKH